MIAKVKIGNEVTEFEMEKGAFETISEFAEECSYEINDVCYEGIRTDTDVIKVEIKPVDEAGKLFLKSNEKDGYIKNLKIYDNGKVEFEVDKEFLPIIPIIIARLAVPNDSDLETYNGVFNICVGILREFESGKLKSKEELFSEFKRLLKMTFPIYFA